MFEEYRKYLLNIRNNLIQNGVSLDNGKCDSYRDIFRLGYEIDGLLWLYSVLEISKSRYRLSDTILPTGNYYKGYMRELFRKEYLASKKYYPPTRYDLENFRKANLISKDTCNKVETVVQLASVENSSSTAKGGVSYSEHGRYVEDFVKPEQDKMDTESYSIHGRYIEDYVKPETDTESYSSHGRYVEDFVKQEQDKMDIDIQERSAKDFVKPEKDTESYSSHGRYVEDFVQTVKESTSQDSTYATHGRYVEDFVPVSTTVELSRVNDYTDHGRFVEDYVEELPDIETSEYSDHGRYVEDFEESHDNIIDRLFAGFDDEDISEGDTSDGEDLSDAEFWYVSDEDIPDSEFGYVEDPEVSEDEEDLPDSEFGYVGDAEEDLPDSEFGYVEDSDDEEEYPDSEFGYSEDMDDEDDLPDSEFGYTSDSEEDTDESSEEFSPRKVSNDEIESVQKVNGHMNTTVQKKDLSDDLQDFTNGLLTSGKRAIVKGIKKLIK